MTVEDLYKVRELDLMCDSFCESCMDLVDEMRDAARENGPDESN